MRASLAALPGQTPDALSAGRITYDLSRLQGLIVHAPGTQRYRPTQQGLRLALADR